MASTTLAQYRTRVAAELGLDSSADQTLIDTRINEGYEKFLLATHCQVRSDTSTTTSGQGDYSLDTDILAVVTVDVTSNGEMDGMERVDAETIRRMRRSDDTSDSPPRYFAVEGSDMLMLYPTPSGSDTITFYFVPRPTALSASSDTPTAIPAEYHSALEFYAMWRLGSYDDDQSSAQGQRYREDYDREVNECRAANRGKGTRRLRSIRVNPRRSLHLPRHNDRIY